MNLNVINTNIPEVLIFEPEIFVDKRGYLMESYNAKIYKEFLPDINFVQDNESKSKFGVLRGLHFQKKPKEHSKLVRVIKGEIQDVVVDIRKHSKTYRKYVSVILNDRNKKQLYVPKGFAHGFLVLSKSALVSYKLDFNYESDSCDGLMYNDPSIGINWVLNENKIILSDQDSKWDLLK